MKVYTVIEPVYRKRVKIFIGGDTIELNKYLKKKEGFELASVENYEGGVFSDTTKDGERWHYVWLKKGYGLDSLAHECVHLVNRIFQDCEVLYDYDKDEHFAYYVGYWFNKINSLSKKR